MGELESGRAGRKSFVSQTDIWWVKAEGGAPWVRHFISCLGPSIFLIVSPRCLSPVALFLPVVFSEGKEVSTEGKISAITCNFLSKVMKP